MKLDLSERRKYIRIAVPLRVDVSSGEWKEKSRTMDISPMGMRFKVSRKFSIPATVDLSIYLPSSDVPAGMRGKVIWQKRAATDDNAPYDVGVEITDIGESKKVALLKYLCDMMYAAPCKTEW
ncbi:MAG: PilZ domain-containing protein [Candidatus Omnitrophica bacterium]|nr:PilZ domain-containing protein [Candidatus Omnitrophota bacterium]